MIGGPQIRAARGLLGWSQAELCRRAGISKRALGRLEAGAVDARVSTLGAVQAALERAGVEFMPASDTKGAGVRLAAPPQG